MYWRSIRTGLFISTLICISFLILRCRNEDKPSYLNHNDSVRYVGIDACKTCHFDIYQSFLRTGMGKSFKRALVQKSAAQFHAIHAVFDTAKNLYYLPFTKNDSMYVKEFRLGKNKDTLFQQTRKIDYIIGSGQHTNSHMYSVNGYVYQIPITWYVQKKIWGLAPGFEAGHNVRFSRGIEIECMSCHNAFPQPDPQANNKYVSIPEGINCERCHGPGSLHVAEKMQGHWIDTSKTPDYTIVNPRRLTRQQQIDICQRCHLQGNTVLKPGKTFLDFKPGMQLTDFMEVYHPQFKGREDEFIMASHAQRLQQSACYIKSIKQSDNSRTFSCISCHNPHISVQETGKDVFNKTCLQCHQNESCKDPISKRAIVQNNCVQCHMPASGTSDIPHVRIHDHRIQIPQPKKPLPAKIFSGLQCIHTTQSSTSGRVEAFLNYVEKFEGDIQLLDSANYYIQQDQHTLGHYLIRYYFIQKNYQSLIQFLDKANIAQDKLNHWEMYCIADANAQTGNYANALTWIQKAINIQSENLDYLQKEAAWLILNNQLQEAELVLEKIRNRNPYLEEAWVNTGFLYARRQQWNEALTAYNKALALNPDYEQALLNRAGIYHILQQDKKALDDLIQLQKVNPSRIEVQEMIQAIRQKK